MSDSETEESNHSSQSSITEDSQKIDIISEDEAITNDITRNLSSLSIRSTSSSDCTQPECILGKSKFMLKCCKCKHLTHYKCTQLPDYQVALFLRKGYRLYVCRTCVGEIEVGISKQFLPKGNARTPTSIGTQSNYQSDKQTNENDLLTHKVNYLEKELDICKSKLEISRQGETSRGKEEDTSTSFFRIEELLEDKLSKIDEKIEETISRKLMKQPTNSKEQIDVAVTNITKHLTENEKKISQKIDSALQVKKT